MVPAASHPTVTSDACAGRILVAEHQVMSCLHSHNSYTDDFVSHQANVRWFLGVILLYATATIARTRQHFLSTACQPAILQCRYPHRDQASACHTLHR